MKNNQIAETFFVKALENISKKNHQNALENLNQTLCFAQMKTEIFADAFAERAKIYREMKKYQKCIDNIQSALQSSVSDEKTKTYKKFQDEILAEISSSSESEEESCKFFNLSHEPHKKIPFIAECLDVKENDVYGRYIMTNKDLKTGDIVVVEEPFYKVADLKVRHTRCAVCLEQNLLDLLPCSKCSTGEFRY